jgi:hypothetical protein
MVKLVQKKKNWPKIFERLQFNVALLKKDISHDEFHSRRSS